MVLAAQLPQEILFHIFQNLKSEELVKAERVCKAWYQNSRRHKILWRDASLYNEEKANFCPIKYYNRFKCLAERNGNNFTKLFLNICLMSLTDDDIRKLIMVLPLVKVEELWIVIGFKRHCPPNHPHCYLPYHTTMQKRSSEAIKIIVTAVLQAIIRLTTLTKLRISSGVDVGEIDLSSCGDPAEWPINRCKLEELHLIRLRYDILFPKEANHQILSNAHSLTLTYGGKPNKIDEKRIWRMIETAKDTLQYCWIERLNDVHHHLAESTRSVRPEKIVSFPALKTFSVDFDDGLVHRIGDELDILEYSMECPVLEDVNLSVMTPDSMLRDLITENTKSSSVGIRKENQTVLNELFERCTRLETLTFWHQPNSTWIYEFLHENTWQSPLKEFRVLLPTDDLFEEVLKFVIIRHRYYESRNLETLSFLHNPPLTPSTVNVISQFVGQVKTYGQPPSPEFTKILNKHNGHWSFEDDERDVLI